MDQGGQPVLRSGMAYLDRLGLAAKQGLPAPRPPFLWRLYRFWKEWNVSPLELLCPEWALGSPPYSSSKVETIFCYIDDCEITLSMIPMTMRILHTVITVVMPNLLWFCQPQIKV